MLYIEAKTQYNHHITNNALAQELRGFFPDLSESKLNATTVGRARKELNLFYLPMRENCALAPQSRMARVRWCQQQQEIDRDWTKVVFSDESWFELGSRKQWVWRHRNDFDESVTKNRNAHPKKVMIWGAIGQNFKSRLVFLDKNITGEVYFDEIIG